MDELIVRYFQGVATENEKRRLLVWLREEERNRRHFSEMRNVWIFSGESPLHSEGYVERAFRRFEEAVTRLDARRQRIRWRVYGGVAASVLLCVVCVVGGYLLGVRDDSVTVSQTVVNRVVMGQGSKGMVTLPDGTRVWLNGGSRLSYPEEFAVDSRIVCLDGEGYFDVVRDTATPFFVEAGGMRVRVLGTRFDMRNYAASEEQGLTLLEGRVEVAFPALSRREILAPNQRIVYNKRTGKVRLEKVSGDDCILWINERLLCENEPLSGVFRRMRAWYGVDIVCLSGVPLDQRVSLVIRNESPEEIFDLLEMIVPIKYHVEDGRIVVSPAVRRHSKSLTR